MSRRRGRGRGRLWQILLVLAGAAALLLFRFPEKLDEGGTPPAQNRVAVVEDGDTFKLGNGDQVRLLSIDTPESGDPFSDEAKSLLDSLTRGRDIHLAFGKERRDRYGRLLAYAYVGDVMINEVLLEQGLGSLYLFSTSDKERPETGRLLTAQRRAIDAGRGIWSVAHAAERVYLARVNSFRFHRPTCQTLQDGEGNLYEIAARREAVYDGLSPCRTCRP